MTHLSIAILARLESPTIGNELRPTLEKRGHSVTVIDISSVPLKKFLDHNKITALLEYDLIYYRSGLAPEAAIVLHEFLEQHGKHMVNLQFQKHPYANAKSYEALWADMSGLVIPNSLFNVDPNFDTIASVLSVPFVAKANLGARGENVHLIDSPEKLAECVSSNNATEYIYQEFIPHDCEYRIHVVGGVPAAMYKRTPAAHDFRSNVSQGGQMLSVEPEMIDSLQSYATKAGKIFDFEIIAVDFMLHRESQELYFTEINLNPGWEISDREATGVDLSSVTADYFERLCGIA
jgi:glutathione synthase/RimK-type ligase-like ATP-grasp enzyme